MVSRTEHPDVAFALPGEWVQVDLDDHRHVRELANLLEDLEDDASSWLARARALGGAVLMLRVRATLSVALLIAWPPDDQSGEASMSGHGDRLARAADAVEHAVGYPCERVRSAADGTDVLTYTVVHPESGRMLLVRVTAFNGRFTDLDVEDYDFAVSRMWWDEADA